MASRGAALDLCWRNRERSVECIKHQSSMSAIKDDGPFGLTWRSRETSVEYMKHQGSVFHIKDDGSFGFIKPHHLLPIGFTNKNVYFKPHGVLFRVGDEVEFILREEDKARPSAKMVSLTDHVRADVKHALQGSQNPRILGRICKLVNEEGYIQPVGECSEEIQNMGVDEIYFSESWVACAHIKLLKGDMVEFNVSQNKKRVNKLSAYQIKLVECTERSSGHINEYLEQIMRKLSMQDVENVISSVLSCDAIWKAIGKCKDLSADVLMKVLDFTSFLEKKSQGRKETFKQGLKALAYSGFCKHLMRFVQTYFEGLQGKGPKKEKVKHFLLMILDSVPEKSRTILQVIRRMLPEEEESMEHFMYKALMLLAPECCDEDSDLNWSELSLVLTASELLVAQEEADAQLKAVRLNGGYESAEEYMDTYFRLLRADCFSGLQTGIQSYLKNTLDPSDMFLYTGVTLVGYHFLKNSNGLAMALQVTPHDHVDNWATSSHLRFGNLLCLSPSGTFTDVIWATVAERDEKVLKRDNIVWVELCDECNTKETTTCLITINKASGRIVMAESPTYYKAYQPIMKALQEINPEELAFQEELVHMEPPQPVIYASEMEGVAAPTTMDPSQKSAFEQALKHRVAVIQGPPGTGKTFLGVKIVEALLTSTSVQLPILVLTYKNHALDEFLKELIGMLPGQVVRIGGRCQDERVDACNLEKLKRLTTSTIDNQKLWSELQGEKSEMECLVQNAIQQLVQSKKFSLMVLLNGFTGNQIEGLLKESKVTITDESSTTIWVCDVLPTWHKEKDYLLDKRIPFSRKCNHISLLLLKFLEAALKKWVPSRGQANAMMQAFPNFTTTPIAVPKKKKSKQDIEPDEQDIVDEENERAAASGKSRTAFTIDIDVMKQKHMNRNLLDMAPSAQTFANEIPLSTIHQITDLWSLTLYDRMVVIQVLLWHHNLETEKKLETVFRKYKETCTKLKEVEDEHRLAILKRKKVVGMTITGASIHQCLVTMLQPAVVLVEEAAEVLEPQIAAVLGNSNVKHMILIGDHKQLRPKVESYMLCRKYHFDVSMMERLINSGYPVATLKLQNRMLPEIAQLLLDIYPDLESNLERVMKNKPPDFTPSMFFWSHDDREEEGRSYYNILEAQRVLRLALVFLQMGYEPGQITILAAYQGQVRLLRSLLRKAEVDHADIFTKYEVVEDAMEENENKQLKSKKVIKINVAIHTIDMFQGDENDIVIISLVRSNENGQIGFLKTRNRRCVAQSRARCGLYIVGNDRTFLESRGSCWVSIINTLYEKKLVGKQFPIHCPLHKGITEIRATMAKDLPLKEICKVNCKLMMDCGVHSCPKLCRPAHTHRKADCKEIVDFVAVCNHPRQRECRQHERDLVCQEYCTQMMQCDKHPCVNRCGRHHSHYKWLCMIVVNFVFKTCQHPGEKRCGQEQFEIKCLRKVPFKFENCKHDGTRKCSQKEEDISCHQPCTRSLTCGHLCEGLCGSICDPSQCQTCETKRKHEREQQLKVERAAREEARKAAIVELKEFIDQNPVLDYYHVDITCDGDCASEYYGVEDRVMKYIQPGHGWSPKVTRIEKITNKKLLRDWIAVKSKMVDPLRTDLKFHDTGEEAIKNITKNGFMLPRKKTNNGMYLTSMYGKGIYFATDSSKSTQKKYTQGSSMLLLCDVLLGHAYTAERADNTLCLKTLETGGYDSVFAPRGTKHAGGVLSDEYVIFRPQQALPKYIVHFSTYGVDKIPQLPVTPDSKKSHLLLPKREFDPSDPLDMHFRLAESQFLRLTKDAGSDDVVKSVEYFINAELAERFAKQKLHFEAKYPNEVESRAVLAFHGTAVENIDSIMQNNFSMDRCQIGAYGAGIYLSEFPDISKGYTKGTNKLILCNVLPGKGYTHGGSQSCLEPGYDSHNVRQDTKRRAWAHVIFNPDQILPLYVITY